MKTLKCTLNQQGIRSIINKLEAYNNDLPDKMAEMEDKLFIEVGEPIIDDKISAAKGDSSTDHSTTRTINLTPRGAECLILLTGPDIAFIEFGAGMHYNGHVGDSPHPKGVELGYTIGSYGYGLGRFDHWYHNGIKSFGTEATMPLYRAAQAMRFDVVRLCREVFL